jgi:hypothetical protein
LTDFSFKPSQINVHETSGIPDKKVVCRLPMIELIQPYVKIKNLWKFRLEDDLFELVMFSGKTIGHSTEFL